MSNWYFYIRSIFSNIHHFTIISCLYNSQKRHKSRYYTQAKTHPFPTQWQFIISQTLIKQTQFHILYYEEKFFCKCIKHSHICKNKYSNSSISHTMPGKWMYEKILQHTHILSIVYIYPSFIKYFLSIHKHTIFLH